MGTQLPLQKMGHSPPPHFLAGLLWPNDWMDQGHSPHFSAYVYCGQTARWITMPLDMKVVLSPGHIVFHRGPAPPPQKRAQPLQFSAHVYCGQTVAHLSYCWALVKKKMMITYWVTTTGGVRVISMSADATKVRRWYDKFTWVEVRCVASEHRCHMWWSGARNDDVTHCDRPCNAAVIHVRLLPFNTSTPLIITTTSLTAWDDLGELVPEIYSVFVAIIHDL